VLVEDGGVLDGQGIVAVVAGRGLSRQVVGHRGIIPARPHPSPGYPQ
jgi:hypothetical protein